MFERFSKEAREVVIRAQEEAGALGHEWIGTEHLLLAALRHPRQPGAATLVRLGVTPASCRAAVAGVVSGTSDDLGPRDAEALRTFGIDLEEVRRRAEESFGHGALDGRAGAGDTGVRGPGGRRQSGGGRALSRHLPFAARAKKALKGALGEALARKDRRIGVEHVVLGLSRSDDPLSLGLFARLGVAPEVLRERVLSDLREAAA
ncbi:Clp protease N-terminal domain-containing protein [Streptomyces reniochalinae]|uniref:Clp protease n=1 Tax=Streptomyces reniochalinae TaxID=2250578 RepID=A0A367E9V7_9ACTN|nr:Clp protease N-terminal domain-containing protein [Streptomyces reniochalinae]RCG14773.1 Clp protease [Streptomyces reniochalinae]